MNSRPAEIHWYREFPREGKRLYDLPPLPGRRSMIRSRETKKRSLQQMQTPLQEMIETGRPVFCPEINCTDLY